MAKTQWFFLALQKSSLIVTPPIRCHFDPPFSSIEGALRSSSSQVYAIMIFFELNGFRFILARSLLGGRQRSNPMKMNQAKKTNLKNTHTISFTTRLMNWIQKAVSLYALTSGFAHAQLPTNQIQLGTPSYNGTGCPLGTVSATLSPDAQSLSILFGAFQAEAGGTSGKTVDRKACQIAVPVRVPQGYSVSVIKIDYRGYKRLPYNASGTFDVEYFFAGRNGPAYHKNFVGAEDGNFTLNNTLVATANVWSDCGADVNLRTNTSIAVQTNQFNEQTMLTLDSADISSGVIYQLSWRQCGMNGGGGNTGGYPSPYPGNGGNGGGNSGGYPYPGNNGGNYPGMGPCVINSYYDSRGYQLYMIKDGMGRVVGNTVQ